MAAWRPGEGEARVPLGHRDKDRAREDAAALLLMRYRRTDAGHEVALTPTSVTETPTPDATSVSVQPSVTDGQSAPSRLTLSDLTRQYQAVIAEGDEDGCLKTEKHLDDLERRAGYLVRHFGKDCLVEKITVERWKDYARKRRAGEINGRKVGTRSVRGDLLLLTAAIRWATTPAEGREPLLTVNPLGTITLPTERDPRRPMLHTKVVEKLSAVAPLVEPDHFPLLLDVVRYTGRRVSSCLALLREDIDFELERMLWRAEEDKKRKTRISPLPTRLSPSLKAHLDRPAPHDSSYVFPHPDDPAQHLDKDRADTMLERAYKIAGIKRERGGLWHPFRRRWATLRKKLPLSDVAEAGGWDDVRTLLTCYQLADPETLRQVADFDR